MRVHTTRSALMMARLRASACEGLSNGYVVLAGLASRLRQRFGLVCAKGRRDVASIVAKNLNQEKCEARNAVEWVADDGKVSAVRVFTDGAAELLDGWPRIATAVESAAAFSQRQSVGGSGDSQVLLSDQ